MTNMNPEETHTEKEHRKRQIYIIPTGTRFGKITFNGLSGFRSGSSGKRYRVCSLTCDCGRTYEASYHAFRCKPNMSCGCEATKNRVESMRREIFTEPVTPEFKFTNQEINYKLISIANIEGALISGELPMTYLTKMFTLTREVLAGKKLDYKIEPYAEPLTVGDITN